MGEVDFSGSEVSAVLYNRYALLLDALESTLRTTGLEIAAKTTVPERALELLAEKRPRLFVAGLETPPGSMDGLELLRRAGAPPLSLNVIALAGECEQFSVDEVLSAGVSAYIATAAGSREDVVLAIRQTFSPSIHLQRRPAAAATVQEPSAAAGILTARELEILQLAADGYTNREVAAQLRITGQTVKFHLSNVYRKLNVSNRTHATRKAQLLNLLHANVV
jgi:two-component system response regulator DevR